NTRPLRRGAMKVTSLMPQFSLGSRNSNNCTTGQLFPSANTLMDKQQFGDHFAPVSPFVRPCQSRAGTAPHTRWLPTGALRGPLDSTDQVFLLGLAFCSDGEGIEQAQ